MGMRELPKLHRDWFLQEMSFWKERGVLSDGQNLQLLALYDEQTVRGMPSRNLGGWILSSIASLLVMILAYVLFFSFTDQMSVSLEFYWIAGFLTILGVWGVCLRLIGTYGRFVSSDLLLTAMSISFWIAMPVLLSKVRPYADISLSLAWWWYPMSVVLLVWCSRVVLTPLMLSASLAGWMIFATSWTNSGCYAMGLPMPGLFWTVPVFILLLMYWAWRRRSALMLGVGILLTLEMCICCLIRYNRFEPVSLRASLALIASALLLALYEVFSTTTARRRYCFSLFVIGITIAGFSLIWAGSETAARVLRQELLRQENLDAAGLSIWLFAFVAIVLCVDLFKWRNILRNRAKRLDTATSVEPLVSRATLRAVLLPWCVALIPLIVSCLTFSQTNPLQFGVDTETVSTISMITINICTLLFVVCCVGYSVYTERLEYFGAGTIFFVIWVIVRYVEYFTTLKETYGVWGSVVFLFCCALFMVALRFVWKLFPSLTNTLNRRATTTLTMDAVHTDADANADTDADDTNRTDAEATLADQVDHAGDASDTNVPTGDAENANHTDHAVESAETMNESVENGTASIRFVLSPPLTLGGLLQQFEYCEADDTRSRRVALITILCGLLMQLVLLFLLVSEFCDVPWKDSIPDMLTFWMRR